MSARAAVEEMVGEHAPPRDNGELVFTEPWHARVFGIAVALVDARGLAWSAFQHHLIAAIATAPDRPYYESWAVALEALVVELGLSDDAAITAATPTERAPI